MSTKPPKISFLLPYHNSDAHRFGVNRLLLGHDDKLYSAGRDGTIKCWAPKEFTGDITSSMKYDFSFSLEEHVDWVNDIVLANEGKHCISCSNDNTIMVWDLHERKSLRTLRAHSDYVQKLAYSQTNPSRLASCSLDSTIFLWDIEYASNAIITNSSTSKVLCNQKNSIYTISMNHNADLLCSGSTDKMIRLYDIRVPQKICKLRGHQDNVRCLLMNKNGNLIISGSTDKTIKVWDLRQHRCLKTFSHLHKDSVWTLSFDAEKGEDFLVSGGRDKQIFFIDTKKNEKCKLLEESNPILSFAISTSSEPKIWVATTNSSIRCWNYSSLLEQCDRETISTPLSGSFTHFPSSPLHSNTSRLSSKNCGEKSTPLLRQHPHHNGTYQITNSMPIYELNGYPGIRKHVILNNRREVLTEDSAGNIVLWDITKGKQMEDYGNKKKLEQKVKDLQQTVSINNWFSVETKLGCLEVTLQHPSCFNAEIYGTEAGFANSPEEQKVNMGEMIISALFRSWLEKRRFVIRENKKQEESQDVYKEKLNEIDTEASSNTLNSNPLQAETTTTSSTTTTTSSSSTTEKEQEEQQSLDHFAFVLPKTTPIIIHNEKVDSKRVPFKKLLKDFDGNEIEYETIPKWIVDALLQPVIPSINMKLNFSIESHNPKELPNLPQGASKLSAHRILRIKKVSSYVIQKLDLKVPTRKALKKYLVQTEKSNQGSTIGGEPHLENQSSTNESNDDEQIKPEEYIEILCGKRVMDPNDNLATVNAFYKGQQIDIKLLYRKKYPI